MATTILHIGDDLCRRIPVMQTAGFAVFQIEVKIKAIHIAFDREEDYSAVVFHNDVVAVSEDAVEETRSLSEAPLILFQNPTIPSEDGEFDLVIPALTPPDIWLQKLRDAIEASREIRERSRQLRGNGASVRSRSEFLRLKSAHNRVPPIDADALWRGNGDGASPGFKMPEKVRPEKIREKTG